MLLNTQEIMGSKSAYVSLMQIKNEKVEKFLEILQRHVEKAREKKAEPGCLRADVFNVPNASNTESTGFLLYLAFVNKAASDFHKKTEYYKEWNDFLKSDAIVNDLEADRNDVETESIPGTWA